MVEKLYVDANQFLLDSYQLGKKIFESDFKPTFVSGIWRGGTPVGIAVQEYLSYHGVKAEHCPCFTSRYGEGIDEQKSKIFIGGIEYIVENANAEDSLLIVDDVFDTGLTSQNLLSELERRMRKNYPADVRIGTVYFKPSRNLTDSVPDYFVHETDRWIVFPHELVGLTEEEIRAGKGEEIAKLLKPQF